MRKLIIILLFPITLFAQDIGGDYYVAHPDSAYAGMGTPSDANDGSFANPWATLNKALETAQTGDTVYFRGGTYYTTGNSSVANSGTYEAPICWFGYPGEDVIFDAFYNCDHLVNTVYNGVIYINTKEHLHFKNFTIRNVFQCDSVNSGAVSTNRAANLTFEQITMHNIGSRGYDFLSTGAFGVSYPQNDAPFEYDTTRFINCDVYNVFDTLAVAPGNASDAWKGVWYAGNYIEWRGCRAWFYGDDAWDPNSSTSAIDRGAAVDGIPATRVFDNCWAMSGSKYEAVSEDWSIEGNGVKLANGGTDDGVGYNSTIMTNCLFMFCNTGIGEIYDQDQRGLFYNNTMYKNGAGYFFGGDNLLSIFRNNIIYGSTNSVVGIDRPAELSIGYNNMVESNNTWDADWVNYPGWQYTDTVTVTDADFVYTDSATLVEMFTAPREADGSLPPMPIQLAIDSDMRNAGTQVVESDDAPFTLTFDGSAPDLGAGGAVKVVSATPADPPPQAAIYRHLGSGGKVYYFNGKYLK